MSNEFLDEAPTRPAIPRVSKKRKLYPKQPQQPVEREPIHKPLRTKMLEPLPEDDEDRLRVPPELIPDGMSYQWVTDSIYGMPQPQRRARFERRAWAPVPASRHPGIWTPKGFEGEINVDGLVLMERPLEYTLQAQAKDRQKARGQVLVKEQQIRGGDVQGVGFDTQHQTALRVNRVSKSYEPVPVPSDD